MAGINDTLASVALDPNMALVVVGSNARDEATPYSDADVWVVGNNAAEYNPVVDALVKASKPTKIDIMTGTVDRFQRLAYEDCHIATSIVDAQLLSGSGEIFSNFTAMRSALMADLNWTAFFLRALRRDCQLMSIRNPAVAVGSIIKFCIGGRMFLDCAIAASIATGQPISNALLAAKSYFQNLRLTTPVVTAESLTDFLTYSSAVVSECARLFGYAPIAPTWGQTEAMREKVRIATMTNVVGTPVMPVQSSAAWRQLSESRTRLSAGFAFVFALEDAGKLDQFDTIWPSVSDAIFAAPQNASIQAALAFLPT